ncbi:MAG: bifunctional 2-C-methyl-D-erythritol 4-phosphate cytidylyltransferase/2-C-methyl-D-erythritol 2,4-cyclodiphosphate synthase, partial [Actinobacteria bacterium]|nr:bifunctional 2-C-methyl-D-erythritol 4-phosphate cytidylyltransferase/2-C-methyl-D-erythritol 2,4-cyclodiphosphate synthase [Actinomycetota bacterium]
MPGVGAIVVAAGRGDRFGAAKQFLELDGVRLVDRAVDGCRAVAEVVVVVVPAGAEWNGPTV